MEMHQVRYFLASASPEMPADVYIKTGERPFFEHIMKPVLDSSDLTVQSEGARGANSRSRPVGGYRYRQARSSRSDKLPSSST